jgi:YD repeat-containing protein
LPGPITIMTRRADKSPCSARLSAVVLPTVEHPSESIGLVHPRYEYRYDAQGNQTAIRDDIYQTDPANPASIFDTDVRVTLFTYDDQGRETSRTLPIGVGTTGISDDFIEHKFYSDRSLEAATTAGEALAKSVALGQLEYEVSFEGVVTAYRYDNSQGSGGRLAAKYYYGGSTAEADYLADADDGSLGSADEMVAYTYDAFGREHVVDRDGNLATTDDQEVSA